MKAVILYEPEHLHMVDMPLRDLYPDEVLLKVEACSICGSDLEGYHGIHPTVTLPRVMGHEVASTVAEVGAEVTALSEGDRVAGLGSVACGLCDACQQGQHARCTDPKSPGFSAHGAYAEYVICRAKGCTPIPDEITFTQAAVAQPAGIANHAVSTRASIQRGEVVLVQGCGPIGLSAMVLSKLRGATVVSTDIVDYRCRFASEMGADLVLNPHKQDVHAAVLELTEGKGADKVIECVGGDQDETIPEAIACVKKGGLVVVVGSFASNRATLPVIDFKFNEKTIAGSQSMPEGYGPIFDLVRAGKMNLDQLVTHRLPLAQLEHGLQLMDAKEDQVLKVVIASSRST